MTEFEATRRLKWFIDGYFIHCIPGEIFKNLSSERLCELYNVKISYFKNVS